MHRSALVLLGFLTGFGFAGADAAPARTAAPREQFRGGKVEWARLQSASPFWNRHAAADPTVLELMRRHTSLNIDRQWHATTANSLESLARYPFLYADTLAYLRKDEARNLAEYLRRGGFILIDACRNDQINPSMDRFLQAQVGQLAAQFPDLQVGRLQPEHEIFSIYFKMREFPPYRRTDGQEPLYALIAGERLIGVISLNGFQCAWGGYADDERNAIDSMQMVANVYIYAMTR